MTLEHHLSVVCFQYFRYKWEPSWQNCLLFNAANSQNSINLCTLIVQIKKTNHFLIYCIHYLNQPTLTLSLMKTTNFLKILLFLSTFQCTVDETWMHTHHNLTKSNITYPTLSRIVVFCVLGFKTIMNDIWHVQILVSIVQCHTWEVSFERLCRLMRLV